MQQTERINDFEEGLRAVLDGFQAGVRTALVGIVNSYDATKGTISVKPSIEAVITKKDGTVVPAQMALLTDIPVCYLGGGNFVATFPIAAGDEALVIFSDRCIDSWFQSGGVQPPGEPRMHSLSDGFAIVGPRSLARKLTGVSSSTAQLRSVDGTTYVEVAGGEVVNVVAPAGINLTGPVTINGNLLLNGIATGEGGTFSLGSDVATTGKVTATGEGKFAGISMSTHVHSGVASGGSDTAAPVPGS